TGAARSLQIVADDADGDHGDAAGLSLLAFNDSATHMLQTQAAADVEGLEIDGIAVTSASNTLTGLIEGVQIRLREPGTTTLDITRNDDAFVDAIKEFVDRYNALVNTIGNLSSYDADTGTAGQLNGDSLLRTVQGQVRDVMSRLIGSNDAAFRHLSQIGLSHGAVDSTLNGTLVLDESRLRAAIAEDHAGVAALFSAASGEQDAPAGYAVELNRVISGMLGGSGLFASVTESINDRIGDIGRQREQLELRMAAFEERTRAKFNAMDILVAQLRSTGNFLTQQLDALPPIGRRD
ncbi:MAG: flagellar filament capping protein FliD, partial [Gammaproteobacteria bacterium]|nr:flagellar filament capping protein FliD [Gammaproteobacteria bacterium]